MNDRGPNNKLRALACLLLFLGVLAGAFGAHALKDSISEYHLGVYRTGGLYHIIHALGMLVLAGIPGMRIPCLLLLAGIIVFSGSLYLLAVTGTGWLGAITPLGGLSFMAAWCLAAFKLFKMKD